MSTGKLTLLLLCFCLLGNYALGQKKNAAYQYHIKRATSAIKIDGVMDEAAWQRADTAADFFMVLPMDTSRANIKTSVRMTYDDNNLYVLAVCYTPGAGPYMVQSLKRDFDFQKNDNFIFFIDPFDARTDGFSFGANAAGGQWDGSMYEGGKVDLSWDNIWSSSVKNYGDRWVFECAIPFKSIRYKKGTRNWGINFSRNDLVNSEKSSWTPIPRQFPTAALAYTGTLVWDEDPPVASSNISVIPYLLGGLSKDFEKGTPVSWRKDAGGDAKVALTSSLNLDLTVNPDFSQVEVDQQVINLNRYELFFPEKRQFFLENGDLFSNFGYSDIRPFFSRRIGLNAPIRFGTRLTGKINKDWRVGVMDLQTGEATVGASAAQNYGILTFQRRVFSRSNIGILFVNRDATGSTPASGVAGSAYNRNVGVEYNLASSNNIWTGKLLGLKSFSPGVKGHDFVAAGHLQYLSKYWTLYLQDEHVGKNYNAEVGYVPRSGYNKISPLILHNFFPKSGAVLIHGIQLSSTYYFDEAFKRTDNESILSYVITFRNRSSLSFSGLDTYVKLLRPFDPTNTGQGSLATGTEHHWNTADVQFVSKPQNVFTYLFDASWGGYYDKGTRLSLSGQVGYRFQPYVNLTLNTTYIDLHLPLPYGQNSFWLVGPRADVTFTNSLYFTTFVQYNQQVNNVNINTRLQWRYRPASDIFIVYGDNSIPSPFTVKNRQLVVKWTYWWNI
ncbi:carbohydrate binding family 9 domain-containing protein [Mucilaginibacter segetis]|uniref:Carbohydrate binding family 9 domain-containing protein n=1 Tax=Mucilaginibacter segetis TaxID=2793071 RepID=A0A934UP03_9SPHI|nr:carbohydrate binding family 9 domain-containing protein [Mucilaginibacter segetis]MBK0380635.1 carbohydrate binding family 9 domain-containing protein [Mucilaginibacter segetis]